MRSRPRAYALRVWQERKGDKYTSADIQNEMLQVMALRILRTVAENIGERKFAIMVDETTESSCTAVCHCDRLGRF